MSTMKEEQGGMEEDTQHSVTQQRQKQQALLVHLHGGILRQARVNPMATAVVDGVDVNKQVRAESE